MKKSNFIFVSLVMILSLRVNAGLLFNYSELTIKDLDQITKMVNDKLKESRKSSSGKVIPLREALQAVYSRPNPDGMIEKVVSPLRNKLDDLGLWEKTISQLTDEAIGALKHPKTFKPVVQGTYVVFLENLLAEIKPLIFEDGFERKLAERIRDAKIEISKEARNELNVRMMKTFSSPSLIATQILIKTSEVKKEVPKNEDLKKDKDSSSLESENPPEKA